MARGTGLLFARFALVRFGRVVLVEETVGITPK